MKDLACGDGWGRHLDGMMAVPAVYLRLFMHLTNCSIKRTSKVCSQYVMAFQIIKSIPRQNIRGVFVLEDGASNLELEGEEYGTKLDRHSTLGVESQ